MVSRRSKFTILIQSLAFLHAHDCSERIQPSTSTFGSYKLMYVQPIQMLSGGYFGHKMILRSRHPQMAQSCSGQAPAHLTLRMLAFQNRIHLRRFLYRFHLTGREPSTTVLKVSPHFGISKMVKQQRPLKATPEHRKRPSLVSLRCYPNRSVPILCSAAWSVSLHPQGETYASTGSSGNVFIHSAQPNDFGQRISTLASGRQKFGMFCKHVGIHFKHNLISDSRHSRAQMVARQPCPRKLDKSTSLTQSRALCLQLSRLMQCLFDLWPGLLTPAYVPISSLSPPSAEF